jgi:hypothetical protein
MVQYRDTTLTGKNIDFNNTDMHFLGPNLILNDCNLTVKSKQKGFGVIGFQMNGGCFEIKSNLRDFQFDQAKFENVKFLGLLCGIDFGWWDSSEPGSIKNCDFTEATFQSCRFLSTEMTTIKLPSWPHFSIPDPARLATWVKQHKWPDNLDVVLEVATDIEPGCSAAVDNAQILADADGISLAEMRELLAPIPGIVITDG